MEDFFNTHPHLYIFLIMSILTYGVPIFVPLGLIVLLIMKITGFTKDKK